MFRVPEGDCCLLCVSILAEDRVISSVLSNLSVLRETQSHSRLPGKRGDPSVRPRPPGAPCTPLCPRRAGGTGGWCGPATYLLLGPAELLLHLLGEQAGRASRLALRHPAGSGRLARRPVVFWRPPRRKCGSQHASHPAVAVAAPPHAARDPRGRAGSSGGPLRAQPPRPGGLRGHQRSAPAPEGDPRSAGGAAPVRRRRLDTWACPQGVLLQIQRRSCAPRRERSTRPTEQSFRKWAETHSCPQAIRHNHQHWERTGTMG